MHEEQQHEHHLRDGDGHRDNVVQDAVEVDRGGCDGQRREDEQRREDREVSFARDDVYGHMQAS